MSARIRAAQLTAHRGDGALPLLGVEAPELQLNLDAKGKIVGALVFRVDTRPISLTDSLRLIEGSPAPARAGTVPTIGSGTHSPNPATAFANGVTLRARAATAREPSAYLPTSHRQAHACPLPSTLQDKMRAESAGAPLSTEAGAIMSRGKSTAQEKLAIVEFGGVQVMRNPPEIGWLLRWVLQ